MMEREVILTKEEVRGLVKSLAKLGFKEFEFCTLANEVDLIATYKDFKVEIVYNLKEDRYDILGIKIGEKNIYTNIEALLWQDLTKKELMGVLKEIIIPFLDNFENILTEIVEKQIKEYLKSEMYKKETENELEEILRDIEAETYGL
jgi:hypothetical protein